MSTPSDQAKLKAKPKHQARERIATLVSLSPSFEGDPGQASDLGMLLVPQAEFDRLDSEVYLDVVYALQSRGLIFGEKEFQKIRDRYLNSNQYQQVKNDKNALVGGFINYMLQAELEAYVGLSNDTTKGHSALYERLLASMQQPAGTAIHPELKADIQEHQKAVKHRELRTQIEFFQQTKQEVPKQFIEKAQQKYPNWSEDKPLPNVNLKKRSKNSVVIDVDDLGVNLDQLLDVMNQTTEKIDLKTEGCHEKTNPFRAIVFEKDGKHYTVGAAYDKDGVFKVHAYECDEHGSSISPEIADPAGWMSMSVTRPNDPAGMDVSDAVADALTKLAHYSKQEDLVADLAVSGEVEVKAGVARMREKAPELIKQAKQSQQELKTEFMEGKKERSQVMDPDAKDTDDSTVAKSKEKYKFQNSPRIVNLAKKISFPASEVAKEDLAFKRGYAGRRKQLTHNIVVKEAVSSAKITENEAVSTITKLLKLPVSEIKKTFQEHAQLTDLEFNRLLNRFDRMEQPEKEKAIMESSSYPEDALVRGAIRHDTANKYPNRPAKQGDWLGREILLRVAEKYGKEQPAVEVKPPVVEVREPVVEVKPQVAAADTAAKDAKVSASAVDIQQKVQNPQIKPSLVKTPAPAAAVVDTVVTPSVIEPIVAEVKIAPMAATSDDFDDEFGPEDTNEKKPAMTRESMKNAIQQALVGSVGGQGPEKSQTPLEKEEVIKRPLAATLAAASAALAKNLNLSGMNKKSTNKEQVQPDQMEIKSDEAPLVDNAQEMGPPPPPPPPPTKFAKIVTSNQEELKNNMQEKIDKKKSNVKDSIPQQAGDQKALQETIAKTLVNRRQVIDDDKNDKDDDFWNETTTTDNKPR